MRSGVPLVVVSILAAAQAGATPECPPPIYAIARPETPSIWTPIARPPGQLLAAGDGPLALVKDGGATRLFRYVDPTWTEIADVPPLTTAVALQHDRVYAFTATETYVATPTWQATAAIKEPVTSAFACGDAVCATVERYANSGAQPEERTFAAVPDAAGGLASWQLALTMGDYSGAGFAGSGVLAGTRAFVVTQDDLVTSDVGARGSYLAVWPSAGARPPVAGPQLVVHGGWLFAIGGTRRDTVTSVGKCGDARERIIGSNEVFAAEVNADGAIGAWRVAAPLPSGRAVRLVADRERLYALPYTPRWSPPLDGPPVPEDAVAITWASLIASVADAGSPPPSRRRTPPPPPATPPWQLAAPAAWTAVGAVPIADDERIAVEYRVEPGVVLHVGWIHGHGDDDMLEQLIDRAYVAYHGRWAARNSTGRRPGSSVTLDEMLVRPPHARHLRLIGANVSSDIDIVVGSCTGEERALAACEAVLATLAADPPERASSHWIAAVAAVVLLFGIAFVVIRRRKR